jgi:hypothetical protein
MLAKELAETLGYIVINNAGLDNEILDGYTSDLLSDVMGNAPEDSVLITIQAHKNTVAVASLAGIGAIILCNNREAPDDMIEAATKEDIAVIKTQDNQFVASYKVYNCLEL